MDAYTSMTTGRVPSILIVDDNVDLAEDLKEVLEEEGVVVHLASDGFQALKLLEQFELKMVVTDMRMPGMDGVGLIREIRQRYPGMPVVLITAYSQDQQLAEARANGVLAVLSKPLDLQRLCELVERCSEEAERA